MTSDDNDNRQPIKSRFVEREMLASVLLGALCLYPIRCQKEEDGELEPRIVEGQFSQINEFPYSAFLGATCRYSWTCGASILNQDIILTAAHCVYECFYKPSSILVKCGNAHRNRGIQILAERYMTHADYSETGVKYDIGLLKLTRPLQFSRSIGRVAVMRNPPYKQMGVIAGWGNTDDFSNINNKHLKHLTQKVTRRLSCQQLIGDLPLGVICGGSLFEKSYISKGDSGSGLVVQGYIQIGIVSFKRVDVSRSIAVYTDVGYYFQWIKENAANLYCGEELIQ